MCTPLCEFMPACWDIIERHAGRPALLDVTDISYPNFESETRHGLREFAEWIPSSPPRNFTCEVTLGFFFSFLFYTTFLSRVSDWANSSLPAKINLLCSKCVLSITVISFILNSCPCVVRERGEIELFFHRFR